MYARSSPQRKKNFFARASQVSFETEARRKEETGPSPLRSASPAAQKSSPNPPNLRKAVCGQLREQTADQRGLSDAPDRQDVRGSAHVRMVLAHGVVHVVEGAFHHFLQPAVHLVLFPEVALQVLRPFE